MRDDKSMPERPQTSSFCVALLFFFFFFFTSRGYMHSFVLGSSSIFQASNDWVMLIFLPPSSA